MLTLQRLLAHVTDELMRPPGSANRIEDLVNEAGVAWTNLTTWSYQSNQKLALPLVVGQTIYPLGAELLEIKTIADPHYPDWGFRDWDTLLMPRADFDVWKIATNAPTAISWYGTVYDERFDGVRQKTLEMWPAPSIARDLSIIYKRGWASVDKLTDAVDLPIQLEPAFIAWVRRFAAGREKKLPFEEAIKMAKSSELVQDAIASDGRQVPTQPPRLGRIGQKYIERAVGQNSWDPRYRGSSWRPY